MSRVAVWMTNYAAAGSANERNLPKALESVLKQSYKDFDLLVFDNHSPGNAIDTIAAFATLDERVKPMEVPKGLAGIELAAYAWRYLDSQSYDYSITIGGHDMWNTPEHLQTLVERMDAEREVHEIRPESKRGVAILYCDTWQLNDEGLICGRYQDIKQTFQIDPHMTPQYVVSGVSSPEFFGLWNERVRKLVPIRHMCAGFDHLVVMNAALHGAIMWEPRVQLMMRAPPATDGLASYGKRHLPAATLAGGAKDFYDQLEWCMYCVDQGVQVVPEGARANFGIMLSVSMLMTYIALRGYNLHVAPGGLEAFNSNPAVGEIMRAAGFIYGKIGELISNSRPPALPPPSP